MKKDVQCSKTDLTAVKDAIQVISGGWKLQILIVLFAGPKRFKEITKEIDNISDKMLSKELRDLEQNQLVSRKVHDTFPPKVEYAITEHTRTLSPVINELKKWGALHRKIIVGKNEI